ncbi:MAG TPA: DNAase, partial [Gammaproteobacteria bacterium]|nr:DNAase [Gammaproteobacteria bacterium]
MLVDSHCHIDFPELAGDFPGMLSRAQAAGVSHLLCVSVNLADFPAMLELTERSGRISASVGVHPNTSLGKADEPSVDILETLAQIPTVVAIGETGLDYFRTDCNPDIQRTRFARHIEAARRVGKP